MDKRHSQAFRGGTYSLIVTVIVLAIVVAVNVFASVLPTSLTWQDISSSKLYSVTSNTKAVVNNLDRDVTIYWIVQSGEEDQIIENLLSKYDSLSEHITVTKRNPDIYPTFAQQYTDETVTNNSLVVESGSKSRYISYSDIYITDANVYSYSYNTSFDGEGAITSAIDYVTSDELPTVYLLTGHGESELPDVFADAIEKENIETASFSLLTEDEIPEDAAAIMIYDPQSDISSDEAIMLGDYAEAGGKILVAAGPIEDGELTNLYDMIRVYGIETAEGVVVEADRGHYLLSVPIILIPDMDSSDITDPLIEDNYLTIMPIAYGMEVTDTGSGLGETVTSLLDTSELSFSKPSGYAMDTYEKEDDDIDGPFSIAVRIDTAAGGEIIWFSSSRFLDDVYNAYSSGANSDLALNALTSLVGESEAMAIRSKSLNYNYLTISASTASLLKILLIGVFPLAFLAAGIAVVLRRRAKEGGTHE